MTNSKIAKQTSSAHAFLIKSRFKGPAMSVAYSSCRRTDSKLSYGSPMNLQQNCKIGIFQGIDWLVKNRKNCQMCLPYICINSPLSTLKIPILIKNTLVYLAYRLF